LSMSDIKVGDHYSGKVTKLVRKDGALVNIGAPMTGFLGIEEFADGFPSMTCVKVGARVNVRALKIEPDKLYLTCRQGPLTRPPKELPHGDVTPFQKVSGEVWIDAKVVRMTHESVYLTAIPPGGGSKVLAILHKDDFDEEGDFVHFAVLGGSVRVRIKRVDVAKGRLVVTMRKKNAIAVSELIVGETYNGTVRSSVLNTGVLVEIGATRPGLLALAEYNDGFPIPGHVTPTSRIKVRILAVDGDQFTLTRRSGPLDRPAPPDATGDVSVFVDYPTDVYVRGAVAMFAAFGVFVDLQAPDGRFVRGLLREQDFADNFHEKVALGTHVDVRVVSVNVNKQEIELAM